MTHWLAEPPGRRFALNRSGKVTYSVVKVLLYVGETFSSIPVAHLVAFMFAQRLDHREIVWDQRQIHRCLYLFDELRCAAGKAKFAPHMVDRGNKRLLHLPQNCSTLWWPVV